MEMQLIETTDDITHVALKGTLDIEGMHAVDAKFHGATLIIRQVQQSVGQHTKALCFRHHLAWRRLFTGDDFSQPRGRLIERACERLFIDFTPVFPE